MQKTSIKLISTKCVALLIGCCSVALACQQFAKLTPYQYEAEFKRYVKKELKDSRLLDNRYILILYANSCSKCTGELLDKVLAADSKSIGALFVGVPSDEIQMEIISKFNAEIDSTSQINRYELNIGRPTFFVNEGGKMYNQTELNENQWVEISKRYGL